MKKTLTLLWFIIIGGVIFITLHVSKPQSSQLETENLIPISDKQSRVISRGDSIQTNNGNYEKTADEYVEKDDYENAISNYQKALESKSDSQELILKLANSYLKNNQNEEARDLVTLALKTNSNSVELNITLAKSYLNMRLIEKAKDIVWAMDQNNYLVQYYRGIILVLFKDFENARKIFQNIAGINPKPEQSLLDKNQKFLNAYENFSYYKGADNIYLELLLAKALTVNEEYQISIPLLYDILNTKNNYRDAWVLLGYSYLNTNKINDAVDALTQAKELTPKKPETLFYLGLAYFAKNDIDKAIYYIEEADSNGYEPKDQINLKLGDFYLIKKEYQKSASSYENVISTNTKNLDVFIRAIWLNIDKLNNPEKALALSQKAADTHNNEAMSFNLLGWSYTAMGDYDKAKQDLDIALRMDSGLDAAHLNYGWLYEKLDNKDLAKQYYKKAYILGHGNSIGILAANRYNDLSKRATNNYQVNISSPDRNSTIIPRN